MEQEEQNIVSRAVNRIIVTTQSTSTTSTTTHSHVKLANNKQAGPDTSVWPAKFENISTFLACSTLH